MAKTIQHTILLANFSKKTKSKTQHSIDVGEILLLPLCIIQNMKGKKTQLRCLFSNQSNIESKIKINWWKLNHMWRLNKKNNPFY